MERAGLKHIITTLCDEAPMELPVSHDVCEKAELQWRIHDKPTLAIRERRARLSRATGIAGGLAKSHHHAGDWDALRENKAFDSRCQPSRVGPWDDDTPGRDRSCCE